MKSGFFGNFFFHVLITRKFFDRFIKCPCFLFSMIGGLINLLSTLYLYVYMKRWIQFLLTYFHHFLQLCFFCFFCFLFSQLIQLLSAVDPDDPVEGHHFYFSMVPEKRINPNFTIRDNQGYSQINNIQMHTNVSALELLDTILIQ